MLVRFFFGNVFGRRLASYKYKSRYLCAFLSFCNLCGVVGVCVGGSEIRCMFVCLCV